MSPPVLVRKVFEDLNGTLSWMIGEGLVDDQNFPFIRQTSAQRWEVSFDGAELISIGLGGAEYVTVYDDLANSRSFSAKLIDGALLQMMYRCDGETLSKHRLVYYPSPHLPKFQDDPDAYYRDELYLEIVSIRRVPFPIRFDFDNVAAIDVDHPTCHLTLGDVQGCRIPVSSALSPRWFIEFVLRNFYKTDSHNSAIQMPTHRLRFDPCITASELRLVHLAIPS